VPPDWLEWTAAFVVGALAVGRVTRLLVEDNFPPIAWWREAYQKRVTRGAWGDLATCPFCMAPWVGLADLAWGWFTELQPAWWFVNLWFAVAYLAAMVVVRDTPE